MRIKVIGQEKLNEKLDELYIKSREIDIGEIIKAFRYPAPKPVGCRDIDGADAILYGLEKIQRERGKG